MAARKVLTQVTELCRFPSEPWGFLGILCKDFQYTSCNALVVHLSNNPAHSKFHILQATSRTSFVRMTWNVIMFHWSETFLWSHKNLKCVSEKLQPEVLRTLSLINVNFKWHFINYSKKYANLMKTPSFVIESDFWAQWRDGSRYLSFQQVACVIKVFSKHFPLINFFIERKSFFQVIRHIPYLTMMASASRFHSHNHRTDSRDLEIQAASRTFSDCYHNFTLEKLSAKYFHSNNDAKRFLTFLQVLSPNLNSQQMNLERISQRNWICISSTYVNINCGIIPMRQSIE